MNTINLTERQVDRVAQKVFNNIRRFNEEKDTGRTFVPPPQLPDRTSIGEKIETNEDYEVRFREWVEKQRELGNFSPSF